MRPPSSLCASPVSAFESGGQFPRTIVQATLIILGGRVPANHSIYRKRVKRETDNMAIDFLSDTP
jgi:hypothetical protein